MELQYYCFLNKIIHSVLCWTRSCLKYSNLRGLFTWIFLMHTLALMKITQHHPIVCIYPKEITWKVIKLQTVWSSHASSSMFQFYFWSTIKKGPPPVIEPNTCFIFSLVIPPRIFVSMFCICLSKMDPNSSIARKWIIFFLDMDPIYSCRSFISIIVDKNFLYSQLQVKNVYKKSLNIPILLNWENYNPLYNLISLCLMFKILVIVSISVQVVLSWKISCFIFYLGRRFVFILQVTSTQRR